MWKSRPVIATPVGGIKVQIEHGHNGLLAKSTEDCAEYMVKLLTDRMLAESIGAAANRSVRDRFLIPRLVQDHLHLYSEVAGTQATTETGA